jgi:hypothetical protein
MQIGDYTTVVEKPQLFSLFYPQISAKMRFKAVMPNGKLRAITLKITDEELHFTAENDEKRVYYRDKREAEAKLP